MTTRKIISLLVVLALCCSLIPAAAASTVSVPQEITDYINAGHDEITLWISLAHPTDAEMEALYKEEIPDGLDAVAYNAKRMEILRRVYSPITEDFIRTQLDGCTIVYRSIYTNTIVATMPTSLVPTLAKNEAVVDLTLDYLIGVDLEPATPNDVTKLQEDFIARLAELGWSVASLKAEDILVTDYGTYSSGKVVLAYSRWMLQTDDTGKLTVGPYTFKFPSGSLPQFFLLYHDGAFTPVEEAYKNGLLSPAELATLAAVYYGEEPCTHDYEAVVTEPTCEQPGSTTYTCSKCGNSYTADEVAATGHKYKDGVCTVCGKPDPNYVPSDSEYVLAESIEAGKTYVLVADGQYALNNTAVNYGNYSTGTDTLGSTAVTIEGDKIVSEVDDSMLWTIKLGEDVPASPIYDEVQYFLYDQEGKQLMRRSGATATAPLQAGGDYSRIHYVTISFYERADGSYTVFFNTDRTDDYPFSFSGSADGFNAPGTTQSSWDPETYGSSIRLYEAVAAEDEDCEHDYKAVVTKPTCETAGYTTYTCACGESYKADEVAATGHKWDNGKVTKEPTEEAEGVKTYTCSACGETRTESIPKLEHKHDYKAVVTKPTCETAGYTTYTCACGESYKADEVAATGHKWDNGKVTKEPTEEAEGVRTFTCTVCGETRTESIPKLPEGHKHDYKAVVTAPTCETAGYTTYTCECGNSYKADEVAALGHDFKDVTVDPTCTEAGSVTKTCSRCDYEETVVLPALGHNFADSVCANCGEQENAEHICPSEKFHDVPAFGTWAHEGIDYCVENELMKGTDKGLFNPKGTLTRAELVTILYRVEGSPEVELKGVFTDVPANAWFAVAVEWAAANKIVNGVGDGTKFAPNDTITREQIATILYRYADEPEAGGNLDAFPDKGNVRAFAVDAMIWATANKIITGAEKNGVSYLQPEGDATREQIATITMRYLELDAE